MLLQFENEIAETQNDLLVNRNETSMFLSPLKPDATRRRRGAAVGIAALAAVGLFGAESPCATPTLVAYEESLVVFMTNPKPMRKISEPSPNFSEWKMT